MKKFYVTILAVIILTVSFAQEVPLSITLIEDSVVANNGLYFDGTKGIDYQFGPRITPHGDCIDVVNGYVFVTWYKGGMDKRNVMLSRKNLNDPSAPWVTIEFPHQHVGISGTNPTIGDSHNTAAIGVSTIDNSIHLLYDMHAYKEENLPNDFFNYSVSVANAAFVPDAQFNLSLFASKRNYLKLGENYDRITYPKLHRADDGSIIARFRTGASGTGDILMARYDGNSWTDNWLYQEGSLVLPNKNSLYGDERFINGKFYSCFALRFFLNKDLSTSNGYLLNSGLYFAYTNGLPANPTGQWFDANDNPIAIPIINMIDPNVDPVQIGEPSTDYGTASYPRTTSQPSWTVTANGAIHMLTRVDNINVHYYRAPGASSFSSNGGGLIPNPDIRGELFSFNRHVFRVDLLDGKVIVKTTLEGTNNWQVAYTGAGATNFSHFNTLVEGDKLYVYLMENTTGDARPLHFKVFSLFDNDEAAIVIEAEDYDTGGQNVAYYDNTAGNSGSVYRTDDVDIEARTAASNGHAVVQFKGDEWLQYTLQAETAGNYDFRIFAANQNRDDSKMDLEINGVLYQNVPITRTFDWEVFLESTVHDVNLIQGTNVVRITQKQSLSFTPDKLEFVARPSLRITGFEANQVTLYPNPSNGVFTIETRLIAPDYVLMNMQGQSIVEGIILSNTLDLSDLSKGIYFLELIAKDQRLTKKLVIN